MSSKSNSKDNPYSAPTTQEILVTPATPALQSRIVRWALLCFAVILIVLSLPIAWHTLELANQEYLHLWNSNSVIYDIQLNGSPVTMATAIRYGATTVLIQWCLAAALVLVSRFFSKRLKLSKNN